MDSVPINWALMRNPVNWVIVLLMVYIAGLGLALIFQSNPFAEIEQTGT
jgi:hypothetical protein